MIGDDETGAGPLAEDTATLPTDNWPVQFRYISRRLVREKVQQHEAARGGLIGDIDVGVELPGIGTIGTHLEPPDYDNPLDLARRTTAAVREMTGTIERPAEYVRTTLTFLTKTCNVGLGWDDETRDGWPIAGLFADEDVAGLRVFVALFGSVSNLHAWREHGTPVGHYTPSDAAGLYLILNAVLEEEDPGISTAAIFQYHEQIQSSPVERLGAARLMRVASGRAFLEEPLEVLAQVFVCERGINIRRPHDDSILTPPEYTSRPAEMDGDLYDLAIIGAPIWVATPEPAEADRYLAAKERRPEDTPLPANAGGPPKAKLSGLFDRLRRSP